MGPNDRVSAGSRGVGEDADAMRDVGLPTRPAGFEEQAGESASEIKRTFLGVGLPPAHRGDIQNFVSQF